MNRRTLLQVLPALAVVLASEAGIDAQQGQPPSVTQEQLDQALAITGLEFPPQQREMMLPAVNRALANYRGLRQIPIPLDTEPAFRFYPMLPGRKTPPGPARFLRSRQKRARRPANIEDLAFQPATELSRLLHARKISSVELTRMYLDRLKKYAPVLNCVITYTEELALKQAERADREIRAGHIRGPLHGVPYGAKDLFATKGIPTTWGAEPFQQQVFDYDATVISRLEKAGAVLLAKLSMGALAQGGLWFGGMTKNPWNIEQSSSGSSAGSASATSAGLVGFSIGTETLGSIVSPSARCGVAGLRPTYGRISRFGAMGLSWTMDKVGAICRSAEDCALVLHAAYGPDGRDLTVLNVPFKFNAEASIGRLRVGYIKREFDALEGEQRKVMNQVLEDLARAGANIKPADFPMMRSGPMLFLLTAEAAAAFDDLTREGGVNQLKGQSPSDWPNSFRSARLVPAVEYLRAQRARTLLMRQMDQLMSEWDVLVSPTYSSTLGVTNLTGHPQVVVPCGFINNEPQAVLFTGRLYEEGEPLRVARAYEQVTAWHNMHPKLST
jgi:Asp-tRNA(Asn)/Glu-tRNA(Gln) amidotransferase A subunit family amidase